MSAYLTTLILFMNSASMIMLWMLMEVNMITFILLISVFQDPKKTSETYQQCLFYFIIQSISSIVMILSSVFSKMMMQEVSELIIITALITKMGIFPLEIWIFKISPSMSSTSFITLLTLQKIPLLFVLSNFQNCFLFIMISINLLSGTLLLWKSKTMKEILISSSIYSTLWMIAMILMNSMTFIFMYTKYTMTVTIMTMLEKSLSNLSIGQKMATMAGLVMLLGIPPMDLFFFKFYTINFISKTTTMLIAFLLWIATFAATTCYLTKMNFLVKSSQCINKKKMSKNNSTMILMLAQLMTMSMLFL